MVSTVLIGGVVLTAFVTAASLRLPSLLSTLICAYIAAIGEVIALTIILSPIQQVHRGALAVAEACVLAIAISFWRARGCPGFSLIGARSAAAEIVRDPIVVVFLSAVALGLCYELLLVFTTPPNNWDSLTYHLPRVAAWVQHGGVYWIPNAPTDRMNEFQPGAEQEILFLFVATGKGSLFALPQFVAELAIMTSIFACARRIGHSARAAVCAAFAFATLSLVALESTTAQNDLVAASFPVAAAALLLAGGPTEVVLAGVAVALGVGAKLTTVLVLPILVLLAIGQGRKSVTRFAAATAVAFGALGVWGFALNVAHTGHVLGYGKGRVQWQAAPSFPGSLQAADRIFNRLFDFSGFDAETIRLLMFVGLFTVVATLLRHRRSGSEPAVWAPSVMASSLPLLAPMLVPSITEWGRAFIRATHMPGHDPASLFFPSAYNSVNEDLAGFGPLGLAVLGVAAFTVLQAARRRSDLARVALALSLPVFIVLLALQAKTNPWIARFLIVPVALTMPLLAGIFRRRDATLAVSILAVVTLALAHSRNHQKPISMPVGHLWSLAQARPWNLTPAQAISLNWQHTATVDFRRLDASVPGNARLGVLFGEDDPSYLLFGTRMKRHVTFLSRTHPLTDAISAHVGYVVIGQIHDNGPIAAFQKAGWPTQQLGLHRSSTWTLAVNPAKAT